MRSASERLEELARRAMVDRGLEPDFSSAVERQVSEVTQPIAPEVRDLSTLPWCSIDNDDSRDLDQLTVADGRRLLIAVADVDALVELGTPIDRRAEHNTTSIYTPVTVFPMLPPELSTDLTSLNEGQRRLALIMDLTVAQDGSVSSTDVYRAWVHNHAQLTYAEVGAWLDGTGPLPHKVHAVPGLTENLRLQDRLADSMRARRYAHGALDFETIQPRAIMRDGQVVDLQQDPRSNAKMLIEDAMIGANTATAQFLEARGLASLRRVVRTPRRWDRIQAIAHELGENLPDVPDPKALGDFLGRRRAADPLRFPDLSLAIVKALGAGEYAVERPGEESPGHFGLAVRDYSHSTAPNRRFPDLITHRLLKAALAGAPAPYTVAELERLARHCTDQEDVARKVERQVQKSAAALLFESRIGERFDALVTGASDKGTWVRTLHPPVEGKVVHGQAGLDIGQRVVVKLVAVQVERGFIDFVRAG